MSDRELVALDPYSAGILNDFGGGNVEWWQDYIRAELGRAHEFYQDQIAALSAAGRRRAEVAGEVVDDAFWAAEEACHKEQRAHTKPSLQRTIRLTLDAASGIIAADAERRVRAAVLEEAAAHFDALAADIGAFATDRVATIIRALKESPHVD